MPTTLASIVHLRRRDLLPRDRRQHPRPRRTVRDPARLTRVQPRQLLSRLLLPFVTIATALGIVLRTSPLDLESLMNRRRFIKAGLALAAMVGTAWRSRSPAAAARSVAAPSGASCVLTPEQTQGPYYIANWVQHRSLLMKKNPYYHGPRPHYLNAIDYTQMTLDQNQGTLELKNGQLDYCPDCVAFSQSFQLNQQFGPQGTSTKSTNDQRFFVTPAAIISYFAYGRDPNGNITSVTHESGVLTYYVFDALDRLTNENWPNTSPVTAYFYYDYDLLNRQIRVNEPPAAAGVSRGIQYFGFDPVSNRVLTLKWLIVPRITWAMIIATSMIPARAVAFATRLTSLLCPWIKLNNQRKVKL